jgi:Uma2 family endonuclease
MKTALKKPKVPLPEVQLLETDGEPLETPWHRAAIALLIEVLAWLFRDRSDYYVGGNMFIYYSEEQAQSLSYRGPDFFYVDGVNRFPDRLYWAVWQENGRYPDFIIELLSLSTAVVDRTVKKDLYEKTFRTHEYCCFDPFTGQLEGWRLGKRRYGKIKPDKRGWLWIEGLNLWLGTWRGNYLGVEATWQRFYDAEGRLVPTRAEAAEAELARLKARLAEQENQ